MVFFLSKGGIFLTQANKEEKMINHKAIVMVHVISEFMENR